MTLENFAGLLSLVCALGIGYAVVSVHVQEGLLIKTGLVMLVMGLFASGVILIKGFDSYDCILRTGLLMRLGLLVSALGFAWQLYAAKKGASRTYKFWRQR